MANILEICQDAASLAATQKPQNLFNGSSQQEAVFLSIVRSVLDSLRRYGNWQELTKEGELKLREGQRVYYALCDEHVEKVFEMAISHIKE